MDHARPPAEGLATEVTIRPFAFANVTSMFVLVGAVASLYGPLLITFSHRFHVSLPTAGAVLSVHFIGALIGVPAAWLAVKHFPGRWVITVTMLCLGVGALDVALVHHWTALLLGVFVIGLGFGGLDFTLNTLLARTALTGRAHRLSLANAGYGVGAVVGPLLIIAVHPHDFDLLFGGVAAVAFILSIMNRGIVAPPLRAEVNQRELSAMKSERRPILFTFIVAYVLYVATESSASGWIASQIHRVGYSASLGSLITGGFWLGLALGRTVGGPLYKRFSDKSLVLGGLALATCLSLTAYFDGAAPFAYPALGLVLASVYPMGLIWYTVLCPHDSDGLALIILFMMAGGIIGPGAESLMVSALGIHVVPFVIALFALTNLAVFASALRFRPLVTG